MPRAWEQPFKVNMRTIRSRFAQLHKTNFGQTVSHGGYDDVEIPRTGSGK
jgi:hypothetical protein